MKNKISGIVLIILFVVSGCGGAVVQTNSNPDPNTSPIGEGSRTTPESFVDSIVNLNLLSLGSDFPPDIQIPDVDGLRSTAFVVTFSPAAVLPVDLDTNPLSLSEKFPVFDASGITEAAFPNNVLLLGPNQGVLLGSTGVIYFNPTTGQELETRSLIDPINLAQSLPYSMPGDCDFNGSDESSVGPGPFSPSFPADMAVVNNRLFVTMSNACFDASFESFYIQGILLIYDIHPSPPFLTPASTPFLVLPGFNATGLTVVGDKLIATSTGDTTLSSGVATPETPSFLAQIDPEGLAITNILNLGMVAANFQPLAITQDRTRGFIGSSAFSEVYEIDLVNFMALRGADDPILIFGDTDDFIGDQEVSFGDEILFVASFNHSAVLAVDLTTAERSVLPNTLDFSFPENPGVTGAGPMALRPGEPNLDFTGPDLWVLTGSPGTMSNALTY